MKSIHRIIFTTILIFTGVVTCLAHEEDLKSKRAPSFSISKRTIDASLAKGTSVLVMNFYGRKSTDIKVGLNSTEFTVKTDSNGRVVKNITKGKYKMYFYLNSNYEEVISDSVEVKDQEVIEVTVYFMSAERDYNVKKPVIYVYPETTTEVKIELEVNGKLGFTYPLYNDGWKFTASPEGKITMNDKVYNYLFWEAETPGYALEPANKTGFLVSSDTLLSFLENSLDQMGFNSIEATDFITFWYPQMIKNEKNHIHFLFNESCDSYAALKITPQPTNIYRVGMIWSGADGNFVPEKQMIPTLNREGFTVVEWGGAETPLFFAD